jgi:hypothetical protein
MDVNADIIARLEANGFKANEQQVEALAHECYKDAARTARADGTYLKILVAGCQIALGPKPRRRTAETDAQLAVIGSIHDTYYLAVMRGITTQEIVHDDALPSDERQKRSLERNRRSAFARTAKSTLVGFVRAGFDLRDLVVETVTKAALREATATALNPPHRQNAVAAAYDKLAAALGRQAHDDPGGTAETIKHVINELEKMLDSMGDSGGTPMRANEVIARSPHLVPTGHGPSPAMIHPH